MLVKGAIYLLALTSIENTEVQAGASEDLLPLAIWGFIGVACLTASLLLLRNMNLPKFAGEEVA